MWSECGQFPKGGAGDRSGVQAPSLLSMHARACQPSRPMQARSNGRAFMAACCPVRLSSTIHTVA